MQIFFLVYSGFIGHMVTMTLESEIQRLVTKTVDAEKLTDAAIAGDAEIYALTGKNDWGVDDYVFGKLQNIGATYGAYTILISWDKEEYLEKAKLMFESFKQMVTDFKTLPLPEEDVNPNFTDDVEGPATTEYWNPYLNDQMPYYVSKY